MSTPPRTGKVNAFAYAQLIKRLQLGDASRVELANSTGLHPLTVGHYVDELRRAKQVYVSAWSEPEDGGRNKVAHYTLGSQPDARRRRLSRAEVSKRYKKRLAERNTPAAKLASFLSNQPL